MKVLLFSLFLLFSTNMFAGGFLWPNVDYSYATLYLMNVPWDEVERPEYNVYSDEIYAASKVGNGYNLSEEFLNSLHNGMVRGVDELIYGLSKCYTPRHGIIYYDEIGNPVASLSICFECERIEFWSSVEIEQHTIDPSRFDIDKAEKQMANMIALMKKHNIPYFEKPIEYETYIDSSTAYVNNGEMFFHLDESDSLFTSISKGQNWLWVHKDHRASFEETIELKISSGGDKYSYEQFSDGKGSRFIYMPGERILAEATIISNKVILPNGISVGMSLDDVVGTFPVYDGIAWPAMISQEFQNYKFEYHFMKQTLVRIEIRSK